MSTLGDIAKAAAEFFKFRSKKYEGDRTDRRERESREASETAAKWKRRQEGWREKSAAKILGG